MFVPKGAWRGLQAADGRKEAAWGPWVNLPPDAHPQEPPRGFEHTQKLLEEMLALHLLIPVFSRSAVNLGQFKGNLQ